MNQVKGWVLKRLENSDGFTLIELLIVMVILAILAGIVIIGIGSVIGRGYSTAYDSTKAQVETAVADYIARTYGSLPSLNGTVVLASPAGEYSIIDMCVLLGSCNVQPPGAGTLGEVPVSAYSGTPSTGCTGTECNNCAGTTYNCSCSSTGHYTWLVDSSGGVYSVCSGSECTANDADGFQGIYP